MRNLDFPKQFLICHGIRKFTIEFPIYKIYLVKKSTKSSKSYKSNQIYYRISYTKNQDFPNLMKIIIKYDISSLYLTFCHEFFIESPWVFSYDPEISCYCQKTIQNTPIHCESNAVQIYSEFSKILGFIAWRFHIDF